LFRLQDEIQQMRVHAYRKNSYIITMAPAPTPAQRAAHTQKYGVQAFFPLPMKIVEGSRIKTRRCHHL